jgi:hypothetical protein
MRVWTFQTIASWEALQRDGVLRGEKYDDEDFFTPWLAEQMAARVGPPPAEMLEPLWGWYRCRKTDGPGRSVNWLRLWQRRS